MTTSEIPASVVHGKSPPRPFLKWAGGKGQLLPELLSRVPASFQTYYEPFLGGGALFFALRSRGRVDRACLSDANSRLMDAYRAVRDDVEAVIAELAVFTNHRDLYYWVRGWRHAELPLARRAARLIYLNKTCYNGLYRENRRGEFNVPFGRYKEVTICDADNLRAVALALAGVALTCHSFDRIVDLAKPGDFVYFDPPYAPLSVTSSFTHYHQNRFGLDEQKQLAGVFKELSRLGINAVLSNSDTPLIRELYRDYLIEEVQAARLINSKAERRGRISELIIRSYGDGSGDGRTTGGEV